MGRVPAYGLPAPASLVCRKASAAGAAAGLAALRVHGLCGCSHGTRSGLRLSSARVVVLPESVCDGRGGGVRCAACRSTSRGSDGTRSGLRLPGARVAVLPESVCGGRRRAVGCSACPSVSRRLAWDAFRPTACRHPRRWFAGKRLGRTRRRGRLRRVSMGFEGARMGRVPAYDLRPQPCALSPAPSALRPQPCALSPAPSALRPQPCALSPHPILSAR